MNEPPLSYDTVIALALRLSRAERAQLIAQIAPSLVNDMPPDQPIQSLRGLLSGPAPAADDIDAVRREMWADFPREDVVE
jgi:hypothetical protein